MDRLPLPCPPRPVIAVSAFVVHDSVGAGRPRRRKGSRSWPSATPRRDRRRRGRDAATSCGAGPCNAPHPTPRPGSAPPRRRHRRRRKGARPPRSRPPRSTARATPRSRARRGRRRPRCRPLHRRHGPLGLGQVDADALPRRPRRAHLGPGSSATSRARHAVRPRAHGAAPGSHRLRVPVLQPGAHARRAARTSRCRWPGGPEADRAGSTVIDTVGLRDRLSHRPTELSGGQQQRVAVARALPAGPTSSSPTSPPATSTRSPGSEILGFMRRPSTELGQTIVMVTHDPVAAAYADRVVFLGRRPDRRPLRRAHAAVDPRPHEGLRRLSPMGTVTLKGCGPTSAGSPARSSPCASASRSWPARSCSATRCAPTSTTCSPRRTRAPTSSCAAVDSATDPGDTRPQRGHRRVAGRHGARRRRRRRRGALRRGLRSARRQGRRPARRQRTARRSAGNWIDDETSTRTSSSRAAPRGRRRGRHQPQRRRRRRPEDRRHDDGPDAGTGRGDDRRHRHLRRRRRPRPGHVHRVRPRERAGAPAQTTDEVSIACRKAERCLAGRASSPGCGAVPRRPRGDHRGPSSPTRTRPTSTRSSSTCSRRS